MPSAFNTSTSLRLAQGRLLSVTKVMVQGSKAFGVHALNSTVNTFNSLIHSIPLFLLFPYFPISLFLYFLFPCLLSSADQFTNAFESI